MTNSIPVEIIEQIWEKRYNNKSDDQSALPGSPSNVIVSRCLASTITKLGTCNYSRFSPVSVVGQSILSHTWQETQNTGFLKGSVVLDNNNERRNKKTSKAHVLLEKTQISLGTSSL